MKNSILLFTLMLLSIAGAKTMQSQGKEETTEWMNQYAGQLLSGKYSAAELRVSASGALLSLYCGTMSGSPSGEISFHGCSLRVPLKKIIIQPFHYTKESWPAYKASFQTNGPVIAAPCHESAQSFSIWASDLRQLERVYNAIVHQAKLNGAGQPVCVTLF